MAIEAFSALTGGAAGIDNTFGYNDMILTPGSGALPIGIRDRLSERDAAGANPSAGLSDAAAEANVLPGDHLYRLPNGGILLRRSIFSDACQSGQVVDSNRLPVSANMTRALAFFSGYTADLGWCRANDANIAGDQITPWDVRGSQSGIRQLEQALALLRTVRAAGATGTLPANIPADRAALARELASATALPDAELTALDTVIRDRRDTVESSIEFLARHPIASLLVAAFVFTDGYHMLRYLVMGGKPPLEGPFSPLGGLRSIYRGIVDFFRRPPGGPGDGSAGNGGGGTNPPPPSGNPPANVSRMSALPDVAAGILAFNGGAGPVGVTGNGVAPVPAVGVPVVGPGVMPVPVIPVPVAVPAPVIAPVVAVPRFVPAF